MRLKRRFDAKSGLFYNWHRSYDPSTGRYTQPDPIGLAGGWNRFTYVENNPMGASDPMGLQVRVPVAVPLPLPVSGGALGVSNADLLMEEVGSGGRDRLGSRSRPERVTRADGDCTPSYRRYLQDSVDRLCKPNPGSCHSNDSCAEAIAKEALHTACADARKKLMIFVTEEEIKGIR